MSLFKMQNELIQTQLVRDSLQQIFTRKSWTRFVIFYETFKKHDFIIADVNVHE